MSKSLPRHISAFLRRHRLEQTQLLLGFSGGADSTALLLALHKLGAKVKAVTFEHGLRGQVSKAEQHWCEQFCQERNIPWHSESLDVYANRLDGESIEQAARRLRLQAWQKISRQGTLPILLGHHADDCLEELFLRLARGANASGLIGLRQKRRLGQLCIYRPLLKIRKSSLEAFLRSEGIQDWCLDLSNQDNRYRRNALRNQLLPQFRQIFGNDQGLLQAYDTLRMDAELLEELAEQSLEKTGSLQGWQSLPPALLPRVLRLWLHKQYGEDLPPSAKLCRRLKKALEKKEPLAEIIPFEGRRQLYLDQAGLRVYTQSENDVSPPQYWRWSEQTRLDLPQSPYFLQIKKAGYRSEEDDEILAEESFARDKLPERLFVRYWQNGDTMRPFGADYTKKLQDLFVDARVPREDRRRLPLLLAGEQIIWLPTLRRAEFGRLRLGEESLSIQFGVKKRVDLNLAQKQS